MMMASQTERSLNRALKGLMERDDKLSALAIADDEEIDQLEKQIDKDGIELLLRFQPVASDLRRVVSAMKLSSNLERIADQATNIARKARKLNKHPALPEILLLTPMQEHAMAMFRDSVDAYVREDAQAARAIIPQDDALDKMNAQVSRQLIDRMARDPEQLRGYINLMFIARHLERVGRSCHQHRRGRGLRCGRRRHSPSTGRRLSVDRAACANVQRWLGKSWVRR